MRVVLRHSALEDLDRVHAWISKDNPSAANDLVARIRDRISFLEIDALAQMGRPGLLAGTRELIEYPYLIVYRVDDLKQEVDVLAILHGAQSRAG
jgi:addiction module RelE/StbE family toxin